MPEYVNNIFVTLILARGPEYPESANYRASISVCKITKRYFITVNAIKVNFEAVLLSYHTRQ